MAVYTKFLVSNKIALYSHDHERVMIMEYWPRKIWGLPGGHLDPGEEPEQAMARELQEELGVTVHHMKKKDFFIRSPHESGIQTVTLAYTAIVPEGFETHPSRPRHEHGIWVTRQQIPAIDMAESYKKFILENWPD